MQLAYDRYSGPTQEAPTLVLLHGIGSYRGVWKPVVEPLSQECQVIAIDLPGFGASPPLPEGQTPDAAALARAVGRFLDSIGIEQAHFVGNSLGGWVSLELARLGRAHSVTAISPAGFWSDFDRRYAATVLRLTRRIARLISPVALTLMRSTALRCLVFAHVTARPWRLPPEEANAAIQAIVGTKVFDETLRFVGGPGANFREGREVRCPVTIAWGTRDALLFPKHAAHAKAELPQANIVRLVGCGHVPMRDDSMAVVRVIRDTIHLTHAH